MKISARMNKDECLYSIALTRIKGVTLTVALHLVKTLGSAQKAFDLDSIKPLVTPKIFASLKFNLVAR